MMFKTFTASNCPIHIRRQAERQQGITDPAQLAEHAAVLWLEAEGFLLVPNNEREDFRGTPRFLRFETPGYTGACITEGVEAVVHTFTTELFNVPS